MYNGLLHAHSGMRWILLILLVITCIVALIKWFSSSDWTKSLQKLSLFTLISAHLQLVIGLILYFISPRFQFTGESMRNAVSRFFMMEHSLIMIIAIALITVGYSVAKRRIGKSKVKNIAIYYTIGLILILYMTPWPWQGYGVGYF